jgi:hypothetical protein
MSEKTVLSRDALLKAIAVPTERIDIPELGGVVIVRGMTGQERDEFESSLIVGRGRRRDVDTSNIRAKLAVRCLIDEQGGRLFKDEEADALGCVRADVLSRIYTAAQRLSGVTDEDIDEMGKSSKPRTGATSPSV